MLAGFLLSGFLLALLGAILPAWGYHRDPPDFVAVGNYFLSLAAGIVAGAVVGRRIVARRGVRFLLVSACLLACATLIYLAMVSPPMSGMVAGGRAGGAGRRGGLPQHGTLPGHAVRRPSATSPGR